jgi:hypothetical protein
LYLFILVISCSFCFITLLQNLLLTIQKLLQSLVLISFVLLVGCAQRDTSVGIKGAGVIPDQSFKIVEGTATVSSSWHPHVSNGYGTSLQVGDYNYFKSCAAIRFYPGTAIPDSFELDTLNPPTVKIKRFKERTVLPEFNAPILRVEVREITDRWTEDSVLAGSFPNRENYPVLSVFSMSPDTADTSYTFIVPTDLFYKWKTGDTASFGLLFTPTAGSEGALINLCSRESGDKYGPVLEVRGRKWLHDDSLGWVEDTILVDLLSGIDAYLTVDSAPVENGKIAISQGYAQRMAIYFPLDSISGDLWRGLEVNRAELYLYADVSNPLNLLYADQRPRYKQGRLANLTWMTEPDSAVSDFVSEISGKTDSTNTLVTFYSNSIGTIVNQWVNLTVANGGFYVQATSETSYLARQIFYSATAEDSTKRPRLKIWFTEISQ